MLLSVLIGIGLVFVPKVIFIVRNPQPSKEEVEINFEDALATRPDQLRYQHLVKENMELKRQIEIVRSFAQKLNYPVSSHG